MTFWVNLDGIGPFGLLPVAPEQRTSSDRPGAECLGGLDGVSNRVLNYREFSFGPNCAFRFNFQRVVQRGHASYVVAVMAPSDFAQL
jgi:hypothetical protein